MLIVLNICDETKKVKVEYVPIIKKENVVRKAIGDVADTIMTEFWNRSNEIKEAGSIEIKYREFAKEKQWDYLSAFCGKTTNSIVFRAINAISGFKFLKVYLRYKFGKKQRIIIQNCIECEAHRELMLEGIKSSIFDN